MKFEDIEIREIDLLDLQEIWELDRLCFSAAIVFSQRLIGDLIIHPRVIGLNFSYKSKIIAFVFVGLKSNDNRKISIASSKKVIAEIISLNVHPQYRRIGLGRRLLRFAHASVVVWGALECLLNVSSDNKIALHLYFTEGYKISKEVSSYYGLGKNAYQMIRSFPVCSRQISWKNNYLPKI